MTHPDDAEGRIADLERQLSNTAAASEAPPIGEAPRTGLRLGWLVLALMVAALVVSGIMLAGRLTGGGRPVAGTPTTPGFSGGGGTFTTPTPSTARPSTTRPSSQSPSAPDNPTFGTPTSETPTFRTPGGDTISVSGVGRNESIDCDGRVATVSGVDNQVVLTGHCARVDVSGVRNTVTVDESDAIVVSGMDNTVTYHSGNPELSKSGLDNTLDRG